MTATMTAIPTRVSVGPAQVLRRAVASRASTGRFPALAVRPALIMMTRTTVSLVAVPAPGSGRARVGVHDPSDVAERAPRASTIARGYGGTYGRGPERGGIVPVPDRVVALLPYLVPLLDGLRYSRFFFQQFPQTIFLLQPLQPLVSMYYRVPFAGVISFFAIYMGLAENQTISVRRFEHCRFIVDARALVLPG